MTAILKVDTIQDTAGNNIINESSNTITIGASGDTTNIVGTLQNNGAALISGITEADMFRLTADVTSNGVITSNLERVDNASYAKIGTGMSQSSGIFTFPSTGLYKIKFTMQGQAVPDDNVLGYINTTRDNSSYADDAVCYFSGDGSTAAAGSGSIEYFFNVTNTTTHKVKFTLVSIGGSSNVYGNTGQNQTCFTFIRLGDSQ